MYETPGSAGGQASGPPREMSATIAPLTSIPPSTHGALIGIRIAVSHAQLAPSSVNGCQADQLAASPRKPRTTLADRATSAASPRYRLAAIRAAPANAPQLFI